MSATAPVSAPTEALAGLVERVTYHNAENGFCVLRVKARGHKDQVTVVGHAATIAVKNRNTRRRRAKLREWMSGNIG
jgi:hypothetical protein